MVDTTKIRIYPFGQVIEYSVLSNTIIREQYASEFVIRCSLLSCLLQIVLHFRFASTNY